MSGTNTADTYELADSPAATVKSALVVSDGHLDEVVREMERLEEMQKGRMYSLEELGIED